MMADQALGQGHPDLNGSRMPGSGKENQDAGSLREPLVGLRDNEPIGLSGSDVGGNGQMQSMKRPARVGAGGAKDGKADEEMLAEGNGTGLGEQLGNSGVGDGQKEPGADGPGQDNPEDDQNYQFYKEYCRLYYANIILTNRL